MRIVWCPLHMHHVVPIAPVHMDRVAPVYSLWPIQAVGERAEKGGDKADREARGHG